MTHTIFKPYLNESKGDLKMDGWLIPAIFLIIVISVFAYLSTVRVGKNVEAKTGPNDAPIPEAAKESPTMMNPIVWAYIIVGLFFAGMIFYYWSKGT